MFCSLIVQVFVIVDFGHPPISDQIRFIARNDSFENINFYGYYRWSANKRMIPLRLRDQRWVNPSFLKILFRTIVGISNSVFTWQL
jgi:hypothetical protein